MPVRTLSGSGTARIAKSTVQITTLLLDPAVLRQVIPGATAVTMTEPGTYEALLSFGLGPLQSRYTIILDLKEIAPLHFILSGTSQGRFGEGVASANVELHALTGDDTEINWRYQGSITGPIALIGPGIQHFAASGFIERFFARLAGY